MTDEENYIEVNSPHEIPQFANEDEEHEFWTTHAFGTGMLKHAQPDPLLDELVPVRPGSISLRLDGDVIRRIHVLARRKGRRYQTLLKEFVTERLYEEEKRDGLVG